MEVKFLLVIFLALIGLFSPPQIHAFNCNKVATLPEDFNSLMPNYQKLSKVHLSNYFFLDDVQQKGVIGIKIDIKAKSVMKVQVTPRNTHVSVHLKTKDGETTLSSISGYPADFTFINPSRPIQGTVELLFTDLVIEEDSENISLKHLTSHDSLCDLPYMNLEIYFEQYPSYLERIANIRNELEFLDEFFVSFDEMFSKMMESEEKRDKKQSRKSRKELEQFKISIHDSMKYYDQFNISIVNEMTLLIPDDEIKKMQDQDQDQFNNTQFDHHIITKYFLKLQMFSDFLLGGSFSFILIHSSDLQELEDLKCVNMGKCILSEKPTKNAIILEAVLTPGEYKLLLVHMNRQQDIKSWKKQLKLNAIPVTVGLKVRQSRKIENRFDCQGRKVPKDINFLLDSDNNNNNNNNILEYKGDFMINMETLKDTIDFSLPNDSDYLIRLTTFFLEGKSIDIELYDASPSDDEKIQLLASNVNNKISHLLSTIRNLNFDRHKKLKDFQMDHLLTLSKNSGETSSLYFHLPKGGKYRLVLNYENSFFEQYERKSSCEMFNLKLVLAKQSYIKSYVPDIYLHEKPCLAKNDLSEEIGQLIKDFEHATNDGNYANNEYKITSKEVRTFNHFNLESNNNEDFSISVIHAQAFDIKKSVNLYVEVISDYLTGDIIPIIIPAGKKADINDYLHKQYQRFILHSNNVNLKINPGKHMLILIHGLTQINNIQNAGVKTLLQMTPLPQCISFKIQLNAILLNNKKLLNWECNYIHYTHIPEEITIMKRDKVSFFSKSLLVPRDTEVINLTTGNDGYVLSLTSQFNIEADVHLDDKGNKFQRGVSVEITLRSGNKILRRAKNEIIEYDVITGQGSIYYYLKPKQSYQIYFTNKNKEQKYYDKCRLFMLQIILVNEITFTQNKNTCPIHIPDTQDIIYERMVDVNHSFFKYGTKGQLHLFASFNKENQSTQDLEVTHPTGSLIRFPVKFDEQMEYSYTFEVKSHLSRATLLLETPYASPIPISVKIRIVKGDEIGPYKDTYGTIVATDNLEDQGLWTIRGVMLEYGKYVLTFYINKSSFNLKLQEFYAKHHVCTQFYASLLIEHKPFDMISRGVHEFAESCPYLEFPDNLSIPGWISPDTGFTINRFMRFRILSTTMVKRFIINEKGLFKFYLPNHDGNSFRLYISLYKIKGSSSKKLIERLEREDNSISTVLSKGKYSIEFSFSNPEFFTANDKVETSCYFFDVYISYIPSSNIIGGVDGLNFKNSSRKGCDSGSLEKFQPNSSSNGNVLRFPIKENPGGDTQVVKSFQLQMDDYAGRFTGELVFNHYIDPLVKILAYHVSSNNEKTLLSTSLVEYENYIWIIFQVDKKKDYLIEIVSSGYNNLSLCSSMVFSYLYERNQSPDTNETSTQTRIETEDCEVHSHLPANFYSNTDNFLTQFGGPQSISTGELFFYGEFLLPKSSPTHRSEFVIKEHSIAFIKLIPAYEKGFNSIFIEIFANEQEKFRFSHNEFNGMLLTELKKKDQDISTSYYLDITFDKVLSNCESFSFMFSLIPKAAYVEQYLSCSFIKDEEDSNISTTVPDSITVDIKSVQMNLRSYINLKESSGFSKSGVNGNLEKTISIKTHHPISFSGMLTYIASDNMMDISLEDSEGDQLELANEAIQANGESGANGIIVRKEISVKLKKGEYKLKLIFHKLFSEMLRNVFESEVDTMCFAFELDIQASILNIKHTDTDTDNDKDDDSSYDPEINQLSANDFNLAGNKVNVITSITPSRAKQLKIGGILYIQVQFAYQLAEISNHNSLSLSQLIYLQDPLSSNIIYPSYIYDTGSDYLSFAFELKKNNFQIKKCYTLHMDNKFKDLFEDQAIDGEGRYYCTMSCECDSKAIFSCGKGGKCKCKYPYSGKKCESCSEGYVKSNSGECVSKNLSNLKCKDEVTCSGHGKCLVQNSSFDPFENETVCKCSDGFRSSGGYPVIIFCNACSNPQKTYPLCNEKMGQMSTDAIRFTFQSGCEEASSAPTLPGRLYSTKKDTGLDLSEFGGGQEVDGALDLLIIFLVKEETEYTEILITEESFMKILFISHDANRARIFIVHNKHSTDSLAESNGSESKEYFLVKLMPRELPYVIKIMHSNLKDTCNRYQLRIVIKPIRLAVSELKCKSHFNLQELDSFLPSSLVEINNNNNTSHAIFSDKMFFIPDKLILHPQKLENPTPTRKISSYTSEGVLSTGDINTNFEYNIKIKITTMLTFSARVLFDFLTNDIDLVLRDAEGKIIIKGQWLTPEANIQYSNGNYLINSLDKILEPNIYYLTLSQNVSVNRLMQMISLMETQSQKEQSHCFKFNLHIQGSPKSQENLNKVLTVEPNSLVNINPARQLEILITFENSISSELDRKSIEHNHTLSFKDVFYLDNPTTKEKIFPSHVYLQGEMRTFLILYEGNYLPHDGCYQLKYNLNYLHSGGSSQITGDDPLVHMYCTRSCDCNLHTSFECDEKTGKCMCEEPYTGDGCRNCMEGWVMARGRCISVENCRKTLCNGHGKCIESMSNVSGLLQCECHKDFNGMGLISNTMLNDCSLCTNTNLTFPDCSAFSPEDKANHKEEYIEDQTSFNFDDKMFIKCQHPFLPQNLDSLGYLHLDGNMHISGKYSIKHINHKHYSMTFTLKEQSHVKIYIESSKSSYTIFMFLLDNKKNFLHAGKTLFGPAGDNTSTIIDFVASPMMEANEYKNYEVVYVIKETPLNKKMSVSYEEAMKSEILSDECMTVYVEMQVMTVLREKGIISYLMQKEQCKHHSEKSPVLIPGDLSLYEYHHGSLNKENEELQRATHIRKGSNDVNYFYHEYVYVPDYLDQELVIEIQVDSKFLNSQVGILLEVVEMQMNLKMDRTKLTSKNLVEIFEKEQITTPSCTSHCFTGIKTYNSVILRRILPSDTFFRVWLYDVSPAPYTFTLPLSSLLNYCANYDISINILNIKSLTNKKQSALCISPQLPKSLNVREFLGDTKHTKKTGFHILDSFLIEGSSNKDSVQETLFEIDEYYLLRLLIFQGRVDTDIELFAMHGTESILFARSNNTDFEDIILTEIPPGRYKLIFKFFPPPSGYHKCEAVRMEFAMDTLKNINENITRMMAKQKNNPKITDIDFYEHLLNTREIFSKDVTTIHYNVKLEPAYEASTSDVKTFSEILPLSELTFTIDAKDSGKIQLISFVNSDFLYLDASLYLVHQASHSNETIKQVISANHRKNMNVLTTGLLEAGTYTLSLNYYRRHHFHPQENGKDNTSLYHATLGELEVDAMMINKSNDNAYISTSSGQLKVPPMKITHSWLCRNAGIPVPRTLSSMRYLAFSTDVHIIDTFILPIMGEGVEMIKLKMNSSPVMMLRVYVECHSVDIDLELREKVSHSEYKTLAKSNESLLFETMMQLIKNDIEYEIVLKFNGFASEFSARTNDPASACQTFKMEIAIEKTSSISCPMNHKHILLTDLRPIPTLLPIKDNPIYRYDSRLIYKGEENDPGYVYMIRTESDQVIEFSSFEIESPVDLRVEITSYFLQAPITIVLTAQKRLGNEGDKDYSTGSSFLSGLFQFIRKIFGGEKLNKAFIVDYSEILENRSTLLSKNLPKGAYTLYIYFPGLKNALEKESRICSQYDIVVEIQKSRTYINQKDIIQEDNLDLPAKMPYTLNTLRFMSGFGDLAYVNYKGKYFPHYNNTDLVQASESGTEHYYNLHNTFTFTLAAESIVEFSVSDDQHKNKVAVSVDGHAPFGNSISMILQPGEYKGIISLENIKRENEMFLSPIYDDIWFYIGISPITRIPAIYIYNNMQSTYRQCVGEKFPSSLHYDNTTNDYSYHNEFFTIRKDHIKATMSYAQLKVDLNKSESNRIFCEIGTDHVMNKLSIKVSHGIRTWKTAWVNNVGILDIIVPKGKYTLELFLEEDILIPDLECILLSIDIHIIDMTTETQIHPIDSNNHGDKERLLGIKCDGGVLPLEIAKSLELAPNNIKDNGEYYLHMGKASYLINRQHSENMNEIDINLSDDSIVTISTAVDNPKEFVISPKVKIYSPGKQGNENNQYIPTTVGYIAQDMKELTSVWILDKNSHPLEEFYTLELVQNIFEEYNAKSASVMCPYYQLDIFIHSISEVVKKFECLHDNGRTLEYVLPNSILQPYDANNDPYHETIIISYFTELQYGKYFTDNEAFYGLNYSINVISDIKDNTEYYLNLSLGYDPLISLFNVYLSKYDVPTDSGLLPSKLISIGTPFFDKADPSFPYKRIIHTTITPGKYVILISETMWSDTSRTLKAKTLNGDRLSLCLPFSYSLDIVPVNEMTSSPEIIAVFPPGPIAFKSRDEDMGIKITLSKPPFTKMHEPVTAMVNSMAIVNSFYLTKIPVDAGVIAEIDQSDNKIYPDKVVGNINGKEWSMVFLSYHFNSSYQYKLHFDSNWIFDINNQQFHTSKVLPEIRIETSKEDILSLVDSIQGSKEKMTEHEFKSEAKQKSPPPSIEKDINKCGPHGKYAYDNILRKYLCTCFDGFSGKYCQHCQGEVVNSKCIINDNEAFASSKLKQTNQSNCGECLNQGVCNIQTGKCVCSKAFTGDHCEIPVQTQSISYPQTRKEYSYAELVIKFIIAIVLLILLYHLYKYLSSVHKNSSFYHTVSSTEYEMSAGTNNSLSINATNENQDIEIAPEDNALVDYEIKTSSANTKKKK